MPSSSLRAPRSPAPHRLGLHLSDGGADAAVWAPHADGIDLCLLDANGREERVALERGLAGVWHARIPGVRAGQRYGLRAYGPWQPDQGHVFNSAKLLLDPYARGIDGALVGSGEPDASAVLSNDSAIDSAPFVPRGVLLAPLAMRNRPAPPRTPWEDTVIYEAHVAGVTRRLPGVPERLRGTYAALGHDATVGYLSDLGITALELLPIHAFASEPHLEASGLTNYWGYNTLGFFAPHPAYATATSRARGAAAVLAELVDAIDRLHAAGIEVILDVVYNHTCEGGAGGRQVSWRGLANRAYYRHLDGRPGTLDDTTGTGNSLDFGEPRVVQMALDSLRYWAGEVGVDGFRFDLATTLGRTGTGFDSRHPFLVGATLDPVIGGVKLIAEPWDVGLGGWQTGAFPAPMAEWNDRFRDTARSFWLEDAERAARGKFVHGVRDLATRLAGSSDVFGKGDPPLARGPIASINFVTSHDGFTLRDLTEYRQKHNDANGEAGGDGTANNRSWNHGSEGATDDPGIRAMRRKTARNLLGTLLLAAGTPMVTAGDERLRTQLGNNNAYCQDNETSWVDWSPSGEAADLTDTVRHLLALRRTHPVLRPVTFYEGRDRDETRRDDLAWFTAYGHPESKQFWNDSSARVLQMMRSLADGPDALVVVNGYPTGAMVTAPDDGGPAWSLAWDSAWESPRAPDALAAAGSLWQPGQAVTLEPFSMRLYLSAESA